MSYNNIFIFFFFAYLKLSKDSSAKYYQNYKERLQKKARETYQSLCKKEKEKSNNMFINDTKIYQKMKNKNWLSIEKK